jgi:L-alanine-DL-glutamate epimerase-like enolase superfamily enzyme
LLEGAFAVGLENLGADIVQRPLRMEQNRIVVPDEPGLGVTLDENKVRECPVLDKPSPSGR